MANHIPLSRELGMLAKELRASDKLRKDIVDDLNETMVDAVKAGFSISQISRLTGIPRMTVTDRVRSLMS